MAVVAAPMFPLTPAVLTIRNRLMCVLIAAGALAVLMTAALLSPDPRGTGSHHQLGLQPCQFLQRTGLPCGTCGMTTSFAFFARGNILASFYVQPFGAALAIATAMAFWAAGYCAFTGRPAYRLIRRIPVGSAVGFILVFWLLAWGWKMWIVASGRDGW